MSYLLQRSVLSSPTSAGAAASPGHPRRGPCPASPPAAPARPGAECAAAGSSRRSPVASPTKAAPAAAPRLPPAAALPVTATAVAALAASDALKVRCKVVVPHHKTAPGQQLVLVGGCEALGDWDHSQGVPLTWQEGHSHSAEVELPIHAPVPCKLVVVGEDGVAAWEPGEDRELLLAPASLATRAAGYTLLLHWGHPAAGQQLPNALRRGGSGPTSPGRAAVNGSGKAAVNGHANGHAANGHAANGFAAGNPLINGVKRALGGAWAADKGAGVIPGILSSWEEEGGREEGEEGAPLVQCQISVLLPATGGPKLSPEQSLVLVGSGPALGGWDPAAGLPLERVERPGQGAGAGAGAGAAGGEGGEGAEGGAGAAGSMWTAFAELPLADGLQAKVVVVETASGKPCVWEPCENRSLAPLRGPDPVLVTAYWGVPATHCLEVDRLGPGAAPASSPQVVQLLRQQLAAASSQLDGLRRERDEAKRAVEGAGERVRGMELEPKAGDKAALAPRTEMVALAEQLSTARRLYEVTKREAGDLGGAVGVTRQLCDAARRELAGLAAQLEAAQRAYAALAPQVERMEKKLASTAKAYEAAQPELAALDAQLERARGYFDRTLQKIEAAKGLVASGEYDATAVRRRSPAGVAARAYAKH